MDRVAKRPEGPRFQMRVPGFVSDEAIGLGDVVKRATSTLGIRPCGGCGRRAEALNRLVGIRGRQARRLG